MFKEDMDPFDRVLHEIDRTETSPERHLSIQIDRDIRAMVLAAETSGQTASVTIKIIAKRKGDMIELTGSCVPKIPKPAVGTVRLYAREGELFDHNPDHAASVLPGVSVETPKRRPQPANVEVPINAKQKVQ